MIDWRTCYDSFKFYPGSMGKELGRGAWGQRGSRDGKPWRRGCCSRHPCGKLFGSPSVVINGEKELSAAEYLYGFSQDGYALVLGNAAYSGGETRYPGMVHQAIRADYLMAAKGCREFDPSNVIKRADIEVRNLVDWYGKSAYCMTFESDDQDNMRFRALEYKKENDEATVLLESGQCSITLFSKYIIPGMNVNEMTFRHQCCLRVCFSAGKTLEEARDFAVKLSKFLSLCMGFHAAIQRLTLFFDGEESAIQYYAPLIDSPAPSKHTMATAWHVPNTNQV